MHPTLFTIAKALPVWFFVALLAASLVDTTGPIQSLAIAVGVAAAGYFGAWLAHFVAYPGRYGNKAVVAAMRSLTWLECCFLVAIVAVFAFAPLAGDPREPGHWILFVAGLIASELSIMAYSRQLQGVMTEFQRRVTAAA